jgi:hypothetical protein
MAPTGLEQNINPTISSEIPWSFAKGGKKGAMIANAKQHIS